VTVGGLVGAGVVLSTLERPASETSVAARTLTRSGEVVSVPVGTPPAAQEKVQAVTADRPTTAASTDTSRAGGWTRRVEHAIANEHCSGARSSSGERFLGKIPISSDARADAKEGEQDPPSHIALRVAW
jgi:hypothetical protein